MSVLCNHPDVEAESRVREVPLVFIIQEFPDASLTPDSTGTHE